MTVLYDDVRAAANGTTTATAEKEKHAKVDKSVKNADKDNHDDDKDEKDEDEEDDRKVHPVGAKSEKKTEDVEVVDEPVVDEPVVDDVNITKK
ncbi:unnamed protein product [Schistosoma mattheei]|nr:unnamed protein product [Schistosoma mattheei]CAH8503262.1 unnamed protein product [Schistosoma mattheei]